MFPIYTISGNSDLVAALPEVVQYGVLGKLLISQPVYVNGVQTYLPPLFMLYANITLTDKVSTGVLSLNHGC